MSALCEKPSKLLLMESAFRSFSSVIATHILAGQVDVQLAEEEDEEAPCEVVQLLRRLWWFARYFNPLNLAWRYYSILAFRCLRRRKLARHHLAILNFECFPFSSPPVPFVVAESFFPSLLSLQRLEISGIFSSQGLLSFIAAYQGIQAIQFTISSSGFGFLPNVTKAMAILGLFRVMVSPWIANKVHVEVNHPSRLVFCADIMAPAAPSLPLGKVLGMSKENSVVTALGRAFRPPLLGAGSSQIIKVERGGCYKALAGAWGLVMVGLVGLSMRSYLPFPAEYSRVPTHLIDRSIELLYNYIAVTSLGFHGRFLWQGAGALGNRNPLFDHPLYHVQTAVFLLLLLATLLIGIVDFVQHDFYSNCLY